MYVQVISELKKNSIHYTTEQFLAQFWMQQEK